VYIVWDMDTHELSTNVNLCDMDTQGMSTNVNCMRYGHTMNVD